MGPCAQEGSTLGLMLCPCCLEMLNNFSTRCPVFSFCWGPCKLCSWSCFPLLWGGGRGRAGDPTGRCREPLLESLGGDLGLGSSACPHCPLSWGLASPLWARALVCMPLPAKGRRFYPRLGRVLGNCCCPHLSHRLGTHLHRGLVTRVGGRTACPSLHPSASCESQGQLHRQLRPSPHSAWERYIKR